MKTRISFEEALELILASVPRGRPEEVPLSDLGGRILAEDAVARVDSPSVDVSLKDGYAVLSADLAAAGPENPVRLNLARFQAAGTRRPEPLPPKAAIRVTTGAALPPGAQAVLAAEFAREEGGRVACFNQAEPGRNVLARGTDVAAGQVVARAGQRLHPALLGLLAAAGLDRVRAVARPQVALIATGDEVVPPGGLLRPGQVYASNLVETRAWLAAFGLPVVQPKFVPDRAQDIAAAVKELSAQAQAFVTSGGAWGSERDLMLRVLTDLGGETVFHRLRLGPGKAAGFGLLKGRPFFILPGGPPSHEAALLLLALPGLLAMAGWPAPVFPRVKARLLETVRGRPEWTQVIQAKLLDRDGSWAVQPLSGPSRLVCMAQKDALILLPEGTAEFRAGRQIEVLVLAPPLAARW